MRNRSSTCEPAASVRTQPAACSSTPSPARSSNACATRRRVKSWTVSFGNDWKPTRMLEKGRSNDQNEQEITEKTEDGNDARLASFRCMKHALNSAPGED